MTQYIRHRLAVAGGIGRVDFTTGALFRIHSYSRGIPRLINLLCDRALLAGYVLEKSQIDRSVVRRAVKELGAAPVHFEKSGLRRLGPLGARAAWLMLTALVGLGAVYLARGGVLFPASVPFTRSPSGSAEIAMAPEEVEEHFQLRLLTLSPEISRGAASAVLLERWGIRLGGGLAAISAIEDMPTLAERAELQYAELDTNLEQLQAFDLPAVLEVEHPSRESVLFLTLTGLDADSAVVYFAPGDFFRLPKSVLAQVWNGRARVFWRDFDELESSDIPRRLAWAGARLATLGMLPEANPTPGELLDAVKKLQERVHLQPDGDLGEETRMALYSLSGGYSVPRLREP
jgi:general secretion pathway protein A